MTALIGVDRRNARQVGTIRLAMVLGSAVLLLLGSAGTAQAALSCFATIDNGASVFGSDDAFAVRIAVTAASAGDTVKIAGTCAGAVDDGGTIQVARIAKTLTLAGGYTPDNWTTADSIANPTTLDAAQQGRVLTISGAVTVTVANLRLTGGSASDGGGILNTGATTTISNSLVYSNNASIGGGGILNEAQGQLILDGSSVMSNTADIVGGGIFNTGSVASLRNGSRVQNNQAAENGGGILNAAQGQLTLDGSSVMANTAGFGGGGIYNIGGAASLRNGSRVQNNQAMENGGGIYNESQGLLTVAASSVMSNSAGSSGGGIFNTGATTTISNSLVTSNSANDSGGGILNAAQGQLTLDASSVMSNTAINGGGIATGDGGSAVALRNGSRVQNNQATEVGGGVYNRTMSVVTIDAGSVMFNRAGFGGGIYNVRSTTTISNSLVFSNSATSGGGLYNSLAGLLTLAASSVMSNTADNVGGGIFNTKATTTISNSLVTSNSADDSGGGIYNDRSLLTLDASSVMSNKAVNGGGIVVRGEDGSVALRNGSRVQNNQATEDGGGIYNQRLSVVTIDASSVVSNTARDNGGGIYNEPLGELILDGSSVMSNTASYGGGISNDGATTTIRKSLVASNRATADGGGIINRSRDGRTGQLVIDASSVMSNTSFKGGGIYNTGATTTIGNSLVYSNSAAFVGGGIYNAGSDSAVTVTASSLLGNRAGSGGALHQGDGGTTSIIASCIVKNSDIAVNYEGGTSPVTATGNWWGYASGPSGAGPGAGDSVSSDVDFGGFLSAEILGCPAVGAADVGIAKAVAPPLAVPGQAITYILTFNNMGQRFARGVVLRDSIPVSVTISRVTSSTVGSGVRITQTSESPNFAWAVSDLAVGAEGVITLTGTLSPNPALMSTQITNTATIAASNDVTTSNNRASAAFSVVTDNVTATANIYLPLIVRQATLISAEMAVETTGSDGDGLPDSLGPNEPTLESGEHLVWRNQIFLPLMNR